MFAATELSLAAHAMVLWRTGPSEQQLPPIRYRIGSWRVKSLFIRTLPTYQTDTLAKSGLRRSANAAKASRASALLSRSANISLSRAIWADILSNSRIKALVCVRDPAGRRVNA